MVTMAIWVAALGLLIGIVAKSSEQAVICFENRRDSPAVGRGDMRRPTILVGHSPKPLAD
jgi:hypothetical protein